MQNFSVTHLFALIGSVYHPPPDWNDFLPSRLFPHVLITAADLSRRKINQTMKETCPHMQPSHRGLRPIRTEDVTRPRALLSAGWGVVGREVLRPVCTSEKVKGWGQDYQSASISPEDQRSDSKADFFFILVWENSLPKTK